MNKKTLIQLAVIVVAFGGSGLILYNGFFKQKDTTITGTVAVDALGGIGAVGGDTLSAEQANQPILPNGKEFNLSSVQDLKRKRNFQFDLYSLPKVNSNDIGVDISNLFYSPVKNTQ